MTEQVVLRVARPYASEDDYIAAEGWTIDDKSIVLIDQVDLTKDTIVRFEVVLDDGSKPIRAEGKVHKVVPAMDERPGGVKVRFRRFDAATKRFIDRVLAHRKKERRSKRPPPGAELAPLVLDPEPALGADAVAVAGPPASAEEPSSPEPSAPDIAVEDPSSPDAAATSAASPPPRTPSGERPRVVAAPPQREALLGRLRERASRRG